MMIRDADSPKLAPGCRLQTRDGKTLLLVPEGTLSLLGTGSDILELVDGNNTIAAIVATLHSRYRQADIDTIRQQTMIFLSRLIERGVLRVQ